MTVLAWLEMAEEDQPPESIWLNDEELNEHFERVKRRYQDKASGMETVPEADMQDNEFVQRLMR